MGVFNNTFVYDGAGGPAFTPVAFAGGPAIDGTLAFKNNLIKRINSSSPTIGMMRFFNEAGVASVEFDYNLFDADDGDLVTINGGSSYSNLAAWQAAYETQDVNSIEGSVTLSSVDGLAIIPDAGGAADGAGLSGLVANDFNQTLRVQPPTIGAWELNNAAIKGTFF